MALTNNLIESGRPLPPLADDDCPNKTTHYYEFEEYPVLVELIEKLIPNSADLRKRETAHQKFNFICNKYQEQPHLFDPYLSSMFEKLIDVVKVAINPE